MAVKFGLLIESNLNAPLKDLTTFPPSLSAVRDADLLYLYPSTAQD